MLSDIEENVTRYRIKGRVPATDECPYFEFMSSIYFIWVEDDLEMIKQEAHKFQETFGLKKWEVEIEKTRDKWERVVFDG